VHESPDNATGSLREASFWRGYCAATFRLAQCIASLCVVIPEVGDREKVDKSQVMLLSSDSHSDQSSRVCIC